MYALNNRAPKYMKQKLRKMNRETDNSTIRINAPLSIMDRTTRQKINKEVEDLDNT